MLTRLPSAASWKAWGVLHSNDQLIRTWWSSFGEGCAAIAGINSDHKHLPGFHVLVIATTTTTTWAPTQLHLLGGACPSAAPQEPCQRPWPRQLPRHLPQQLLGQLLGQLPAGPASTASAACTWSRACPLLSWPGTSAQRGAGCQEEGKPRQEGRPEGKTKVSGEDGRSSRPWVTTAKLDQLCLPPSGPARIQMAS